MRRILPALALAAALVVAGADVSGAQGTSAPAASDTSAAALPPTTQRAPHNDVLVGEGFDTCNAPSTGTMRLWTDSRYRAMNIYIGGVGRAPKCTHQPELTKQWVSTVTSNGWSLIPTYVGRQPPCGDPDKPHFTARNAKDRGKEAAVDAVGLMKSLGMGRYNPVYLDVEPFDVTKVRCTQAAVDFVSAYVHAMHHRDYRAGLYAHHTMGLVPLRARTHPKPDDIWWANWNGVDSTSGDPAVGSSYRGHRIHQYAGSTKDDPIRESYHRQKLEIDRDAVHADVVGKVRPRQPSGPPYVYAASPPYDVDTGLRARVAPQKDATVVTTYSSGAPLSIECQTTGDSVYGDVVWDRLTDGSYVSDLYTTTTGRISFTDGMDRCPAPTAATTTVSDPGRAMARAPADTSTTPAPTIATFAGEGFDKCDAPSTADLRSWLASPYRAVNIYFGGANRACKTQAELTPQWVTTVTSNGWGIIPTFLGPQAPCQGYKTEKFTATNASAQGTNSADNAADAMVALGLGAGNPVYFDMEPFNVDNAGCKQAAVDFISAWTAELHLRGYVSGLYAHPTLGLKPMVNRSDPRPDDVWWPRYDDVDSTDSDVLAATDYVHHRIKQYANSHDETFSGVTFQIDNDAVDSDVVGAVTPDEPTGPPYVYAASPPAGSVLKEHSSPAVGGTATGTTYQYGEALPIECQAAGETGHGSYIWDRLSNGFYVQDLYTTTTGGLSFTPGIPTCDTTPPTVTVDTPKPATLARAHTFRWSGDDPDSGIGAYDVRSRAATWSQPYGSWSRTDGVVATSLRLPLPAGSTLCVEVRATDRSGNRSGWSGQQCIARALDDRSATAKEGWRLGTGDDYYFHTVTSTRLADARLVRRHAELRRVGIVAMVCPHCGDVAVYVRRPSPSHLVGTLSLQAATKQRRVVLLLPPFDLRSGAVRVIATSSGAKVHIDGLVISRR